MKPTPEGQGVLTGIQSRLLARRTDPETSRGAVRKVVSTLTMRQQRALACLFAYGPGTTHELAARATRVDGDHYRATSIHHELARRLPELARKGKAEVTGEVRGGCRVWMAIGKE